MGYLAQRKKHIRTDFALKSLLFLLAVFSIVAFAGNTFCQFLNQWRFQFYLLSLLIMVYALSNRFFLYAFLGGLLFLLNFFVVSSSASVFLSGSGGEGRAFRLLYQREPQSLFETLKSTSEKKADLLAVINPPKSDTVLPVLTPPGYYLASDNKNDSFMVSAVRPQTAGRIDLGGSNKAAFIRLRIENKDYVFLSLDLSAFDRSEKEKALEYINAFVAAEDDPVIIFGNFGMTAWSPAFSRFLSDNGLEVKNSLFSLLTNIILPPTDYVVGYRNLQVDGCRKLDRKENNFAPLLFKLKI